MMWRTVSFVERIEVAFEGNLFNQAVSLADVDNDKKGELVVGSTDGNLAIFKGQSQSPWKKCSDLGMITCIGSGDIYNKGKNILMVLTAEGWCYMFEVKADNHLIEGKDSEDDTDKILKPSFTQRLTANGKVLLIADIDGDGHSEVVVGYADREVRCFKWSVDTDGDGQSVGKLQQTAKWQLKAQIGSLTVNTSRDGKPQLLVSQPGGTYVILHHAAETETNKNKEEMEPLEHVMKSVSTDIVGNIKKDTKEREKSGPGTYHALCTLDGTLAMLENKKLIWSVPVDDQLFSLTKLDITGNGTDEVVCCAWDGQTYIVNHSGDVVRYQFEENVTAFIAGMYSVNNQDNVPCFVYVTFNNTIYIYYNISLPHLESTNLIDVMDTFPETRELLSKLNISNPDTKQLRELYHWCLYGWKPNKT